MAIYLGKSGGCVMLVCLVVCSNLPDKTSALICYVCDDPISCQADKLGQNGSLHNPRDFAGGKITYRYGIEKCLFGDYVHNGSEFCYTRMSNGRVFYRGCNVVEKSQIFDTSVYKEHLSCNRIRTEQATTDDNQCSCYTDYCNGDPVGCCPMMHFKENPNYKPFQ